MMRSAMRSMGVAARVAVSRRWASAASPIDEIGDALAAQGRVPVTDFVKMLKVQGCNYTDVQLDELVKRMDTNRDGFISMNEYQDFLYPVGFCDGSLHDEGALTECERRHLRSIDV